MFTRDNNTIPTGISQMVQSVEQAGQVALTGRDLKISCFISMIRENKTEEIMQLRGELIKITARTYSVWGIRPRILSPFRGKMIGDH